jgi:CheY-like chemotaxis protein
MAQRVLIVDDEPDVVKYLSTALSVNGYDIAVTDNVSEGLKQVVEFAPDLICLDIMMPKESGISMYIRLKEEPTTRSIPVIIISGVAPESQFDFRSYVADETVPPPERFLEKPVSVGVLLDTVEKLIRTHPQRSAGRVNNG